MNQTEPDLFKTLLSYQRNSHYSFYRLAHAIPWTKLEEEFALLYGRAGPSSHPNQKDVCPACA